MKKQRVAIRIGKIFIRTAAIFFAAFATLSAGATSVSTASAATIYDYTAYDRTKIEDDLRDVDVSAYGKNENARHMLIDEAGFMEYGYSSSSMIVSNYYGLYFYVYNPTEREISTAQGANVVNMAVKYDADGEPSGYANVPIAVLDCTSNHRFYKFKLTDARETYTLAASYAKTHGGTRRYDIGSIQLTFKGDKIPTDSFVGRDKEDGISYTYYCTGYSSGCAPDGSEKNTLKIERKKLETISLDLHSTWYRTGEGTGGNYNMRNTLSSVYFAVPNRYVEDYGALQIVKCEWYEYQTNWVIVTDYEKAENAIKPYLGITLPVNSKGSYYDSSIPFELMQYLGPSDSGKQGLCYNYYGICNSIPRLDWIIKTSDISATVSATVLEKYANNYPIYSGDTALQIGEKTLNAALFSDVVDEGHTRGYNVREFDARNEEDWIDLKIKDVTSGWQKFLGCFGKRDFIVEKGILPIEEITAEQVGQPDLTAAQEIFVDETEIGALREYRKNAEEQGKKTYILRFSTSEYTSIPLEYSTSAWNIVKNRCYAAKDTVYLDFDIIHLGFVKKDKTTIIPVVADPIDIYFPVQPPREFGTKSSQELLWWLAGIAIAGVVAGVATLFAKKE